MVLINYFNKTYKNINKTINSFNKLNLINKLFIIFLILLFISCIFNSFNNIPDYYSLENFTFSINDGKKYEKKIDNNVYDLFYSKYYDAIHLNKDRNMYEFKEIKKISKKDNNIKILDVGCGTGYTVKIFQENNYNILGLDKSEAMISKAKSNYSNCEFIVNDILKSNIFDYEIFSHILCLGKTIYEIKDKETFFENCYSILSKNGLLIINLINRDKFKPYVQNKDSNTLYDPEKYRKKVNEIIVKFDKNNEFISKYKLKNLNVSKNNNKTDNSVTPFAMYNEKFSNFKTNQTRENEINLYMPEINKIIDLAIAKNFVLFKKIKLEPINYNNEYLYIFKK